MNYLQMLFREKLIGDELASDNDADVFCPDAKNLIEQLLEHDPSNV